MSDTIPDAPAITQAAPAATPEQTGWLRSLLGGAPAASTLLDDAGAAWDGAKQRATTLYDEADAATNRASAALCDAAASGIGAVADTVHDNAQGIVATVEAAAVLTPGLMLPVLAVEGARALMNGADGPAATAPTPAPILAPPPPAPPPAPAAQAAPQPEPDAHAEQVEQERRALRRRILSRRRGADAARAARQARGEEETREETAHEAELYAAEQRIRREILSPEEAAEPAEAFDTDGTRLGLEVP